MLRNVQQHGLWQQWRLRNLAGVGTRRHARLQPFNITTTKSQSYNVLFWDLDNMMPPRTYRAVQALERLKVTVHPSKLRQIYTPPGMCPTTISFRVQLKRGVLMGRQTATFTEGEQQLGTSQACVRVYCNKATLVACRSFIAELQGDASVAIITVGSRKCASLPHAHLLSNLLSAAGSMAYSQGCR